MIHGSTIKQAVGNINGIINPLGDVGGAYLTFGPEMYWEKSGARWLGGKGKYNPIISIIHHFLNVVKENIPGYNADTHSVKLSVVLSTIDYVQVPQFDVYRLNEKNNCSWIYHPPLCYEGSWIYIWRNGTGCKDKVLVKIPCGSIVIKRMCMAWGFNWRGW